MNASQTLPIPSDLDAEEAYLGAALVSRGAVAYGVQQLEAGDFYLPAHAQIFDAMRTLYDGGSAIDETTITSELKRRGVFDGLGGAPKLVALRSGTPAVSSHPRYVEDIKRAASARRVIGLTTEATTSLRAGADPYEPAEQLAEALGSLDRIGTLPKRSWLSIDEYLDAPEGESGDWLIPGLCYRDSRIIVIASEKSGKSVALRQIAYCAAMGIHPFRLTSIRPIRVAIIDAENPDREMKLTGDLLRKRLQGQGGWVPENLALASYPFTMDLRDRRTWNEVNAFLEKTRPELVVTGPVYKMIDPEPNESDPRLADAFQKRMGKLMERFGFALILEHHAPIGREGQPREIRSMGGQRWAAWADATLALEAERGRDAAPTSSLLVRHPHPSRGRFEFPERLDRGRTSADYPWMAKYAKREQS